VGGDIAIRSATAAEAEALVELILAAGTAFRDIGMAAVSDNEPPSPAHLAAIAARGHAWVAADADDRPVGCILVDVVDGNAHVEEVSVHPEHAGRRLGARLVDHVEGWARTRGLPALTLTTFVEVPWNGPYYRRLGFAPIPENELTPGLARVRQQEHAAGLDVWGRTAMRRQVRIDGVSDGWAHRK